MRVAVASESVPKIRRLSAEFGTGACFPPRLSPRILALAFFLSVFVASALFAAEPPAETPNSVATAETAASENASAPGDASSHDQAAEPPPASVQAAPAKTAEELEAERLAAEVREKRERERVELLESAEHFVETADQQILDTVPYPLNLLFGITLFHITLWRFLAAAGLVFLAGLLLWFVGKRFKRRQESMQTGGARFGKAWQKLLDVAFLALRNPIRLIIVSLLIRSVSNLLVTAYHPEFVWFSGLLMFLAFVWYLYDLVGLVDEVYGDRLFRSPDRLLDTIRPIVLKIVRFIILLVAGMQIYQGATGQTMVSVIAGLGIGGLALALASQETLKNLLGFASIAFDQAFLVGDDVAIGTYEGTVEHVGLRSMRIRAYDGTAVVLPNATVVNANIVNKNRRPFMRREIRIHLSPLNPYAKVRQAMDAVEEVVKGHEGKVPGKPPVVRFVDYEPARFVIQALYWYDARQPDYYDEASRINLEICRKLSEAGVLYADK